MTSILAAARARLSNERLGYLSVFAFSAGAAWLCVLDIVLKQPVAIDFKSFYCAAVAASRGLDVYDVTVLESIARELQLPHELTFPYLYPPFFAHTFSWLARLSPDTAQQVWSSTAVVSYGLAATFAVVAIRRATRGARDADDAARGPAIPTVLLAFIAFLAWSLNLRHSLAMGQVNPLVLVFICAALALSLSGKDTPAGLALAVAAGIKVTPILLAIPWVLQRRFRALAGLAAGLGALVVISLPFGAAPAWLEFLRRLPRMSHGSRIPGLFDPGTAPNFSLAGFYARLFGQDAATIKAASVITILLLLGAALALGGRDPSPSRSLRMFLPLLVTMVVASPFTYVHHVLYIFPAALYALDRAAKHERRIEMGALVVLISLATIDFPYVYERFKAPLPPLALSVNLYVLLAIYALGMHMLWRERREGSAAPGAVAPERGGQPTRGFDRGAPIAAAASEALAPARDSDAPHGLGSGAPATSASAGA
ncbi:glycosyltransferase family 87 protein [Sorangium sp. So ce1153]|uniref:glycosyltransferase family 87 protein n=1 Tax=Sorangium sp. So ce1153 TaxID=3133333 RepID=UPI003F608EE6